MPSRQNNTGEEHIIVVGSEYQPLTQQQLLQLDKEIIISQQLQADGSSSWIVADVNRLPVVLVLLSIFAIAVIAVGRWQGFFSLIGMAFSLTVLVLYVVPRILSGENP